jgi:hypothetical protein
MNGDTYLYLFRPAFSLQDCNEMIADIKAAMKRLLDSGVKKYNIGSRGLERLTFKELQDALLYWLNQRQALLYGGSMVARRVIPTDT